MLTKLQSSNPTTNLLSEAITTPQTKSYPIRYAIFLHAHHFPLLDHRTHCGKPVHQKSAQNSLGSHATNWTAQQ